MIVLLLQPAVQTALLTTRPASVKVRPIIAKKRKLGKISRRTGSAYLLQ
jgi:hypothetical protein